MTDKKILKAIKIRLYPTDTQVQQMILNFGHCRFVFNQMLDMQKKRYKNGGKFVNEFDMNYCLKALKIEHSWLKLADATSLQQVSRDVNDSFTRFFNKQSGFPKFKSRKFPRQSYTSKCVNNNIKVMDNHHLKLPKLGIIKYRCGRQVIGKIKRATIRMSATGKFYVAILVEQTQNLLSKTKKAIGIDRNVDNLCTLSDGQVVPTIRFDKNLANKKHIWQTKLARRRLAANKEIAWDKHNKVLFPREITDFKNVEKARIMVAKYAEKESNQRMDYLQKISTSIVLSNEKIVVENLSTKNMLHNHKLARAISNQGWYKLETLLSYKCYWYGRNFVKVPARNTTQRCSDCGYLLSKEQKLTLQDREWTCPNCKEHHIRDVNAAINILNTAI